MESSSEHLIQPRLSDGSDSLSDKGQVVVPFKRIEALFDDLQNRIVQEFSLIHSRIQDISNRIDKIQFASLSPSDESSEFGACLRPLSGQSSSMTDVLESQKRAERLAKEEEQLQRDKKLVEERLRKKKELEAEQLKKIKDEEMREAEKAQKSYLTQTRKNLLGNLTAPSSKRGILFKEELTQASESSLFDE